MLDLSNQLVNCRPIVERVWMGAYTGIVALVTIVKDGRKDVGNYEAIIVTETQTVQTWGKNAKTLLTHARRRAAGI
jgi:hypothetical protein